MLADLGKSWKTKKGGYLLMPKQVALTKTKTPEYHLSKPLRLVKGKFQGVNNG